MALLQCSHKLLLQIGAQLPRVAQLPPTSPGRLGDWCATMFPLDDRQAALFMSQRTLLSFVILEGKRFDVQAIGLIFWGGLEQILELQGCKKRDIDAIVDSYSDLPLTRVANASLTSQMNALVRDYQDLVMRFGGLKRCDVGIAIRQINQRPRKALAWATPQEVTRELFQTKTFRPKPTERSSSSLRQSPVG